MLKRESAGQMVYKRAGKRPREEILEIEDVKVYKFKVLLVGIGASVNVTCIDPKEEMLVKEFVGLVKMEYLKPSEDGGDYKRPIMWESKEIWLEDVSRERKIRTVISFRNFQPNKCYFLKLYDGSKEIADTFENMWDLTPDTDMLLELPQEYTFYTALADLIDNSLQAVWSNSPDERRLISVTIDGTGISIFDTGPGMDGNDETSIVKWGKMGASLHRSYRGQAIGGKPPYLTPFFGMFGYGGAIASMHLGRHALVSSKTKESGKVYMLHLKKEALMSDSGEKTWKTDGGIRDQLDEEISLSPHGSFTKVQIFQPFIGQLDVVKLKCRLKDIYFPYIQCDELVATGKTSTPVEFQVNNMDLAEFEDGEVATTNLLSCNGPEFVFQLYFSTKQDTTTKSTGSRVSHKANARLKCVYFPLVEGKESIAKILESLDDDRLEVDENFDTFCRVSIRRLGRLLPDARWGRLPFMEPRQKKGGKAQLMKRCCSRVKCFVETDAGFNPNPYKTDLAHHHSYTIALKNFGNKPNPDADICAEVYRGQKLLDVSDLRKEYEDWISVMHGKYDQEVVCGDGQSDFFVLSPVNKKVLAFSSDVVRVRKDIERKGTSWKSGQRIKILKGAAPGCHKNNIYATLEYILVEGFEEDVGAGEALLICRPLDVPEQDGCLYEVNSKNPSLDIRRSLPLPISIIDLGKCLAVTSAEWNSQLEKVHQKAPSTIDLLTTQQCLQLELDGTLPIDASIYAGQVTLKQIVAVVRPVYFNSPSTTNTLDQKYIIKDDLEMSLELNYIAGENKGKCYQEAMHIYGARIKSSSHKELRGLYIFKLDTKFQALFRKAGVYTFSFSVTCKDSSLKKYEKRIIVKPCTRVNKWELINDGRKSCYKIRVGSCFPGLSVASYDEYGNQMPFKSTPDVSVKVMIEGSEHAHVEKKNVALSSDKMILEVSDILVEESDFHKIRPSNEVTLEISSKAEPFSVSVPCVVAPGPLHHVRDLSPKSEIHFVPGNVIGHVLLEMLDAYDNHTEKGTEVLLNVDGLCFQDHRGSKHEIDDNGCINLSGLLKVVGGYGETVSLSVNYEGKTIFEKKFQVEKRFLRTASRVPKCCYVGFQLENIYFEIVNFEGVVDETIDDMKFGLSHTLKITLESVGVDGIDDICRYVFRRGRCHVSMIPIPREQGVFSFLVAHSLYSELCVNFKINVIQSPKVERIELSQLGDVVHSQLFREDILALPDSSFAVSDVGALISPHKALENYVEVFERNVTKAATRFADYERNLAMLNEQKKEIEQGIEELQGSILPQSLIKLDYVRTEKEAILERINGKCNTAASVFCDLAKAIELQEAQNKLLRDMIGVVFQLGTVESNSLSRVLSDYLGEDQMLAVVCKSYAAAKDLEKYGKHGNIDHTDALHAVATKLGKSITGRFLVICLEDISPYCGECKGDDQQNKLALQDPLLPDGNILSGFLGYAVNMINLDADHLFTRTAKGHGLRETLFYLLFGDLQVYETREHLRQACCYTKHGAISLDGGIMKGNGVLSLGYCQPEICFPVIASEIHGELSPSEICSLKQIQDRKLQLENISDEIQKENKACAKARKKFESEKKRFDIICKDCLLLSQNYLEHKSDTMDRS